MTIDSIFKNRLIAGLFLFFSSIVKNSSLPANANPYTPPSDKDLQSGLFQAKL